MAFGANFEHTYDFSVTGDTYAQVQQAAMEEAERYYGDGAEFTILKISSEPISYSYTEHGSHRVPRTPMAASVWTRMREPLDGGNTRANRRRTREDRVGGRLEK